MVTIKLAFRNIMGAGLRTWLNIFILSVAFVSLIWIIGLINGVYDQMEQDTIRTELGGGQFWHREYDPYDPLTLVDAHGALPAGIGRMVTSGNAVPILVTAGAIFPEGRMQSVLIKGIPPRQAVLSLPTGSLANTVEGSIPAFIGSRMASQSRLRKGDCVTARWRDVNGTFDAVDVCVADIMYTTNPAVDLGQIWIPLQNLREMLQAPDEATLLVISEAPEILPADREWIYHSLEELISFITEAFKMDAGSTYGFVGLVLAMALLAIFDTQALAIFRRRKEMGTLMALGMARGTVIRLFTIEGSLHGALALLLGSLYGIPLLLLTAKKGIPLPDMGEAVGIAMPTTMYPTYGLPLWVGATLLVLISVTAVSYLPTRKISKLRPTDAIRGKLS